MGSGSLEFEHIQTGTTVLAVSSVRMLRPMSYSSTTSEPGLLRESIEAGIDRLKSTSDEGESGTTVTGTAKELFDVLVSTDALLQTIELDKLPDVIEVAGLPELVDLERLSDVIEERNPDLAFDLSNLKEVVDERELWNSIDLLEFGKAKRTLDEELEDVLGEDALAGAGDDSEGVSDVEEYVSELRAEAKDALLQQEAREKAKFAREAVVEQRANFERLYASNKARFRESNEQGIVRNPTVVSLLPSGPVPDSVSTRLSTVPAAVRHAKIDALPRIYGRRWKRTESKRRR